VADKEYQKLPGGGTKRKAFLDVTRTRASLWMGKDHLLYQLSTGFTEDYKRFYYGDIQSIVVCKTMRFMVWNFVLSGIAIFCGLLAVALKHNIYASPVLYTVAFFFFLFFGINLAMGPTCICHLYTQVSEEELYSLKRIRTARKALKILTSRIEEKQRVATTSDISSSTFVHRSGDQP